MFVHIELLPLFSSIWVPSNAIEIVVNTHCLRVPNYKHNVVTEFTITEHRQRVARLFLSGGHEGEENDHASVHQDCSSYIVQR